MCGRNRLHRNQTGAGNLAPDQGPEKITGLPFRILAADLDGQPLIRPDRPSKADPPHAGYPHRPILSKPGAADHFEHHGQDGDARQDRPSGEMTVEPWRIRGNPDLRGEPPRGRVALNNQFMPRLDHIVFIPFLPKIANMEVFCIALIEGTIKTFFPPFYMTVF